MKIISLRNLIVLCLLIVLSTAGFVLYGNQLSSLQSSVITSNADVAKIANEAERLVGEANQAIEDERATCGNVDLYINELTAIQTQVQGTLKASEKTIADLENTKQVEESGLPGKEKSAEIAGLLSTQADELRKAKNRLAGINNDIVVAKGLLTRLESVEVSLEEVLSKLIAFQENCKKAPPLLIPKDVPTQTPPAVQAPATVISDFSRFTCPELLALKSKLLKSLDLIGNAYYDLTVDGKLYSKPGTQYTGSITLDLPGGNTAEFKNPPLTGNGQLNPTDLDRLRNDLRKAEAEIRAALEAIEAALKKLGNCPPRPPAINPPDNDILEKDDLAELVEDEEEITEEPTSVALAPPSTTDNSALNPPASTTAASESTARGRSRDDAIMPLGALLLLPYFYDICVTLIARHEPTSVKPPPLTFDDPVLRKTDRTDCLGRDIYIDDADGSEYVYDELGILRPAESDPVELGDGECIL